MDYIKFDLLSIDAWREPDLEKRRAASFASWRVAHETRWSRRGLVMDEGSEQGEEGSGGAMTFRDDVSNTSRSETGDGSDGDKNASTLRSARYRARGDVASAGDEAFGADVKSSADEAVARAVALEDGFEASFMKRGMFPRDLYDQFCEHALLGLLTAHN